jgi:hypothetical protein
VPVDVLDVTTTVTTDNSAPDDGGAHHAVVEIHLVPGDDDACGFDLAALVLADVVEAGEAVPMSPRFEPPIADRDPYSAIGFGATCPISSGQERCYIESGTRRRDWPRPTCRGQRADRGPDNLLCRAREAPVTIRVAFLVRLADAIAADGWACCLSLDCIARIRCVRSNIRTIKTNRKHVQVWPVAIYYRNASGGALSSRWQRQCVRERRGQSKCTTLRGTTWRTLRRIRHYRLTEARGALTPQSNFGKRVRFAVDLSR